MRKLLLSIALVLAVTGALFLYNAYAPSASGQGPDPTPQVETQGDNSRSLSGVSPNALNYQSVSNPYCYQPDATRNECMINVSYWQFSQDGTTAPYLGYALVKIDGKVRYRSTVFFENSITYNYAMAPGGFKVECGTPNQGGFGADFGKIYTVVIAPYEYNNNSMGSNSAVVACPAYAP
ncbi:MAG TPA: hypothetical protein PJ988_15290 [Anaerolinea sp.]|nr:hypothetical protein [Anaerolinea sp.]